jgi:hypothetical protein
MSKERLTALEMLLNERIAISEDYDGLYAGTSKEQIMDVMQKFAAQEVEAAIAETKKQRDELLNALKTLLDYPAEDLVAWGEGTQAIECTFTPYHIKQCLTAITNAQEK